MKSIAHRLRLIHSPDCSVFTGVVWWCNRHSGNPNPTDSPPPSLSYGFSSPRCTHHRRINTTPIHLDDPLLDCAVKKRNKTAAAAAHHPPTRVLGTRLIRRVSGSGRPSSGLQVGGAGGLYSSTCGFSTFCNIGKGTGTSTGAGGDDHGSGGDFTELFSTHLNGLKRRKLSREKRAGILVPLCHVDEQLSVLFTMRSSRLRKHAGEVSSFPGGMADEEDKDIIATALRETEEELGLHQSRIRVLGTYHDYTDKSKTIAVTPVVAILGGVPDCRGSNSSSRSTNGANRISNNLNTKSLCINRDEVEEAFTIPVETLLDPAQKEMKQYGSRGWMPFFRGGPHVVWGLTALVLDHVLQDLLLSKAYQKDAD
eukprot:Nk52_evm24s96 gene=Nk52_evmTU24s96